MENAYPHGWSYMAAVLPLFDQYRSMKRLNRWDLLGRLQTENWIRCEECNALHRKDRFETHAIATHEHLEFCCKLPGPASIRPHIRLMEWGILSLYRRIMVDGKLLWTYVHEFSNHHPHEKILITEVHQLSFYEKTQLRISSSWKITAKRLPLDDPEEENFAKATDSFMVTTAMPPTAMSPSKYGALYRRSQKYTTYLLGTDYMPIRGKLYTLECNVALFCF